MNKAAFIELLENPEKLGKQDEQELKEIVTAFPYFETAHLLLAKSLHNQGSYHFDQQLRTTALYASDRKKLYHLLHAQPETPEVAVSSEPINEPLDEPLPPEPPSTLEEETPPPIEDAPATEELPIVETEPLAPEVLEVAEDTSSESHQVDEELSIPKDIEESAPLDSPPPFIPEPIPEEEPQETPEPVITESELPQVEETKTDYSNAVSEPEQQPTEEESVIEEPKVDTKHAFSSWLDRFTDNKTEESDNTPILPEEEISSPDTELENPENQPELSSEPSTNESSTATNQIINQFISNTPSISRGKASFYDPVNMARLSVEEDEDLVSETLAKLNWQQGNLNKAIKIYQKLSLIYPDKLAYFAGQIEKIRASRK